MEENDIDFTDEHWRLDRLTDLRKMIPNEVENIIGYRHPKIQTFFKKVFTRNIFNIIRTGKNPFKDLIHSNELITEKNLVDFYSFSQINNLDWKWLDEKLKEIYNGSHIRQKSVPITVQIDDKYIHLSRIGAPIKISEVQYQRAKSKYIFNENNEDLFHKYLYLVASRYVKIGSTNHHCSMPPDVIKFTKSKMELFGSPINTCSEQYCSPFYETERVFGSVGSFFDIELSSGVYSLDPPYDDDIMTYAFKKAINVLKSVKDIVFICCIPVWDQTSQIAMGFEVYDKKDFRAFTLAKESEFLQSSEILEKQDYPFYNYYLDEFIGVSNTHLLVLSNNNNYQITAYDIKEKWAQVVKFSSSKLSPKLSPKYQTNLSPKTSPKYLSKTSSRNSPKTSPRNSPKTSPRNSPKTSPKTSPKNSPRKYQMKDN